MLDQWLQSIDLAQYSPAFAAERITFQDLPDLTETDLRDLGLTIGERRRFRRAVREGAGGGGPPASVPAPAPHESSTRISNQGERRPLTVMFADVVGSTMLAGQVPDEEMLDLMRAFRELCGAAISRTGGRIAKFLGDGILAYFCYPIAHENDPHRAVRAALEITARAGTVRARSGEALAVRVGIASGSVILGDLFDGGQAEMMAVTGSPLNLAARLQGCAPPGGVVIGEATHGRIGHLFNCDALGLLDLKGLGPVQCWLVQGEERQARTGLFGPASPVRGRDAEAARLLALWDGALAGTGASVLLRGEAGVGKSALAGQFLRTIRVPPQAAVTLAGSDLDRDTPFFPVRQYLRARIGKAGSLQALLQDGRGDPAEAAALLAKLAGLPFEASAIARLSPPQQRDRTLEAALTALLSEARDGPLCLIAEDLHWFDPSSLELLGRLVDRAAGRSTLILMTAREAFDLPWHGAVHEIRLLPLGPDDVRQMAADLMGMASVPPDLLSRIVDRTDGVPLFVQEIVRQVNLSGYSPVSPGWDTGRDVPSTLQEALMARLDQAGPAKEVAQAASTIGRRVDRGLLGAILDMAAPALEDCLVTLEDGGVLRPDAADGATWVFTHALVRDIAYSSLLREPRRILHERVADALPLLDPAVGEEQPGVMALHLNEAGRYQAAAAAWMEAGRKALAASALLEATRLLRRGQAALAQVAPADARTRLELELLGLLGPALIALSGPGAAETRAHYDKSFELCQSLEEQPAHFPLYWGWWRVAPDIFTWRERSTWLLGRARRHADPGLLLQAHHCNWASHCHLGEYDRCCEHIEAGLAIYASQDWRHHLPLYGNHDALACAHGELALVHWMQGRPEGGLPSHRRSLAWAQELRHLGSLMHSMDYAMVYHAMRQSHAEAYRAAEELTAVTVEHGFADHEAKGQIYRGWVTAVREDPAGGLRLLQEGFAKQQDIGTSEDFPIFVCLLAETLMAAGQPERAAEELLAARAQFEKKGLRFWLPEVLRVTAAAMAATQSGAACEPVLEEAAAVADCQGVHMLGLRIARDRAQRHPDPAAGAALLNAALGRLPIQDTPDHRLAQALGARLQGRVGERARSSAP